MKYLVSITETLVRKVVIEAEDACEAEQKAQDLCNDEKVVLDWADFEERTCEALGEANKFDLETLEQF